MDDFPWNGAKLVPHVQVTVLYEDTEAALRAKTLMSCVVARVEAPAEFELGFWDFGSFDDPSAWSNAAYAAEGSAIVLVSAANADRLAAELMQWVEAWLPFREGNPSAFILLLEEGASESFEWDSLPGRLQRAVERDGVVFYCERWSPEFDREPSIAPGESEDGNEAAGAREMIERGCLIHRDN